VLVRTFVRLGCRQLQLNALNADKLREAKAHPERHRNLIVRVWGWSEYFCELAPEYQDHVIQRYQAAPSDAIVLYSDGITDHMDAAGHDYDRGRLTQVVRAHCRKPAGEMIAAIFDDLDKFSTTAFDDQTVFAMKVK
jgi:serine/threonine protein phosphatase PrpC